MYVTRFLGKDLERQITFLQVDSNGCIYSFISCRNHNRSHESHISKDGFSLLQEGNYQHDIEVIKSSFMIVHVPRIWLFCIIVQAIKVNLRLIMEWGRNLVSILFMELYQHISSPYFLHSIHSLQIHKFSVWHEGICGKQIASKTGEE